MLQASSAESVVAADDGGVVKGRPSGTLWAGEGGLLAVGGAAGERGLLLAGAAEGEGGLLLAE